MLLQSPINVLLIGSGGREHALALGLSRSPNLGTLYATGMTNPGISAIAQPVDVPVLKDELYRLSQFCDRVKIDLIVIGPEDPLAEGWGDQLRKRADGTERLIFGPGARGAMLEADKAYAKQFMRAASIPTAEARIFDRQPHAEEYLNSRDDIYVIKAAGLAKGKGVIVPKTNEEGLQAIRSMMGKKVYGDAGKKIIIEEMLNGTEVSVLALLDGKNILILPPCQDHKRLGDGDEGPNTGGMGAFCPTQTVSDAVMRQLETDVFVAAADAMRRDEIDFKGVLYAGIMLTLGGPKVLEFNVRFGDPECQTLLARLESDAIELFHACATGQLHTLDVRWRAGAAMTVVLAAAGYPESPRKGDEITGIDEAEKIPGVVVDQAGTAAKGGSIVTNGGRVLGVTAVGADLAEARARAYEAAAMIRFAGKVMRGDIAEMAAV